jgi:group I intron endonuclease
MYTIYSLIDPNTGEIRYIGLTILRPEERLRRHLEPSALKKHTHKNHWFLSLLSQGKRPILRIVQQWESIEHSLLREAEKYWIEYFKSAGCPLLNKTIGGEGVYGYKHTPEAKIKMSKAQKGRKFTKEHREKIGEKSKGRDPSPETRAKLSAASKGNKHALGYKHTKDARARISAALEGNQYRSGQK